MLNPLTLQLTQYIGERVGHLLIEQEKNILTLEDLMGNRYLVTVENVFTPTEGPLPNPDTSEDVAAPTPTTESGS